MRDTGRVIAVVTSVAGDELVAAAAAGATSLIVVDPSDFSEDGGSLRVTTEDGVVAILSYLSATEDGTIQLGHQDSETGVITPDPLPMAAAIGDRVEVYDETSGTVTQETVTHVAIQGTSSDDAVEAIVTHALIPYLPEGIRDEGEGEVVALDYVGDDLTVTDVYDLTPSLSSEAGGWVLGHAGATFNSVGVAGALGAETVSGTKFTVNGRDLETEVLGAMPYGLIVHAPAATGTNTNSQIAESGMFRITAGAMYANRFYRITYAGHTVAGPSVTGDVYQAQLRYTTDGSAPAVTAPVMARSPVNIPIVFGGNPTPFYRSFFWSPAADYANVRFNVTGQRLTGTGGFAIRNDIPEQGFFFAIEDMGLQTNVGGTIIQTSPSGTGGTDPATYTKSWTATWGQNYKGDLSQEATVSYLRQGYRAAATGNERSLFGFDYTAIQSALSGSTIKSATLTFRGASTGISAVVIRSHNLAAAPTTWSAGAVAVVQAVSVESTSTVTLGTAIGNGFRDGTMRGLGFGPGSDTSEWYLAKFYGVGSGYEPKLTITYSK